MEVMAPETVGLSRTRLDKLTAWMDNQVASNRLSGLSTMIHRHWECAYFNCTGQMDMEAGVWAASAVSICTSEEALPWA